MIDLNTRKKKIKKTKIKKKKSYHLLLLICKTQYCMIIILIIMNELRMKKNAESEKKFPIVKKIVTIKK